jgi:phage/conjugal plasmid C-4 type zinc finger TraR family protein
MADEIDRAQALEEAQRDDALAKHRRLMPHGDSAEVCDDCGEPIPVERRAAVPGVRRCVACQQLTEIEMTMRAKP